MERAGRLIPKLKLDIDDPETRARAAWKLAAGKKVAEHTRATALVRGTLIIEVGDYLWQTNLAKFEAVLLKNLAEALGEPVVERLDFRPMPARRGPQRAESAHRGTEIDDPILDFIYRQQAR
jgi:predicted nucleic acid-binding Zn ribbon protein